MNPPGLFDLPTEVRAIIYRNISEMSKSETLNRNDNFNNTIGIETARLAGLRMTNREAVLDPDLMNDNRLLAEYKQGLRNIRTGEDNIEQLNINRNMMFVNHDNRMKTYAMILRTREERKKKY